MPDYTVSGDVDSMLRSANDAAIRSAIGLGQTDAPTFLAQTLTGQSLTGTQATSLVDLAATWNTSGTPTAIKLNVVETGINSNAASLLMDLQVGGASKFRVNKSGDLIVGAGVIKDYGSGQLGIGGGTGTALYVAATFVHSTGASGYALGAFGGPDVFLTRDAPGILAQRNGTNAQAFRVYNTYPGTTANEWFEIDWKTSANVAKIGTAHAGTGGSRGMEINAGIYLNLNVGGAGAIGIGGSAISFAKNTTFATDNTYDIGAIGANRPRNLYVANSGTFGNTLTVAGTLSLLTGGTKKIALVTGATNGVLTIADSSEADFNRLQLGGTLDTHPAIARDGAGIKFTGAAAGSTSWIKVPAVAVSALPSAATAGVGARSFVNDALTPVFGSAVTGGGAVTVPVYSTGSAWNVG